jgi:hypothetical protein
MKRVNSTLNRGIESQLQSVVEPLANYISATNRPRAALKSALSILISTLQETNRAASAHVATIVENR